VPVSRKKTEISVFLRFSEICRVIIFNHSLFKIKGGKDPGSGWFCFYTRVTSVYENREPGEPGMIRVSEEPGPDHGNF
jgi:hypothetical protein